MLSTAMTLGDAIRIVAEAGADQEVLVCGSERLTNRQLLQRIDSVARGLVERGVRKGDRIIALLPPGSGFASLFFAAARLGAVIVPLNPELPERALQEIVEHAQPTVIVSADSPVAGLESGATELWDVQVDPSDLLALLYTSGTTGKPKATMHTHGSLIAPVVATLKIREQWARPTSLGMMFEAVKAVARYRTRILRSIGKPQTIMSTAGWHTITGIHVMLQGLLMGDRLVAMPRFHPHDALALIEGERVTIVVAVPTAWQALVALPDIARHDLSSLFVCASGGAACQPELAREIRRVFGCALYNGFGMTEAAGGISVSSLSDSDSQQDETVGRVMPGIDVRVVDQARRELPPGDVGELAVRGEGVMLGYYKAPELTATVRDGEGWLYTGDLARIDEKGYIHIVGRRKDTIIRGGLNIYPAEIESVLEENPKIEEAAVVGVPSIVGGESVWAFVRLAPNAVMTVQEVLDSCRGRLEVFKIPTEVRFAAEFPRGESGKPQKFMLREEALKELRGGTT
ncbi:MAG TPA: AMP-binding protein [Spirochaetia bacterium]|nr:AMP-binding protein [Spirochaetia bacterium]